MSKAKLALIAAMTFLFGKPMLVSDSVGNALTIRMAKSKTFSAVKLGADLLC